MKKSILLLLLIKVSLTSALLAQSTRYGDLTGELGDHNCYFGVSAGGTSIPESSENTFIGIFSGMNNTASFCTAVGAFSMASNTTGQYNVAVGRSSLAYNTTGRQNVAIGNQSMFNNINGLYNTGVGSYSLMSNTAGESNTAVGMWALHLNTIGADNCALGESALLRNTTGKFNSAVGSHAMRMNVTGSFNSALGLDAGPLEDYLQNTLALGSYARTTASDQVRLGNTSITSIGGVVSWSTLSDKRFKKDIKEDVLGLDFINLLKPVSYTVDIKSLDTFLGIPDSTQRQFHVSKNASHRQIGFIAQDVEAIVKKTGFTFSGVEAPQNDKDHYSLRYSEFVIPLVKAVQELSAKVEEQQHTIDKLLRQLNQGNPDSETIGGEVMLYQNAPNPFSDDTEIKMVLPEGTRQAFVRVYALDGKELKSIQVNGRGTTLVKIAGNELSAGMYIYSLIVDNQVVDTKRMILTK